MKKITEKIKWNIIGSAGKLLIDFLLGTSRIKYRGADVMKPLGKKAIMAVWHSRILLPSYIYKNWDSTILVSRSKDGEIIARILQKQGHETIRGSTSKGGLKALSRQIHRVREKGGFGTVIPDGPQGPRYKVQPGIIVLAKRTGFPIVPLTYSAKTIKVFNSWDRFIIPFPFTKCLAIYGEPVFIPSNANGDAMREGRDKLEKELRRITVEADYNFGHFIP